MFDAYTVKKVVPRLLIAAILIQLSWPLFTYMIYIVGQISWGIEGLLYAPFGGSQALELKNILAASGGGSPGTAAVLTFGGIGVGIVALTLGGTLLMALSILLALIIAFFVLAARQVLIVILLVTAPLALVAWILPNTEKMWKIWWESFSKVLFMYPLILLLIAGGKITARIISELESVDLGNGGFQIALIFIAFFGPYFLIPATFKVAGSAFANISGMMNDRSRGVFDRLRKGRQEIASQAHQDRMAGKTTLGSGRTGSLYRRAARFGRDGSFDPRAIGREKFGAFERKTLTQSANELIEADAGFAAGQDDATSLAVQKGMTRDKFIKGMMAKDNVLTGEKYTKDEAVHALAEMETSFGTKIGTGAMRVAAYKIRAGSTTAYSADEEGKMLMGEEGGALIRDGLMSTQDVAAAAKANRGRADIAAAGFVDQMKFFEKGKSGTLTGADAAEHTKLSFEGADPREIVGGHQNTTKAFSKHIISEIDTALASGDHIMQAKAMAKAAGIYDTLASTSPKKAAEFAEQVFGQPVTGVNDGKEYVTVREAMEGFRADPIFLDHRREYSSRYLADANSPAPVDPQEQG